MTKETNKPEALSSRIYELMEMLTYRRPSGSKSERAFIAKYIHPLGALPDEFGNYWLTIGESPILWSSHTDTVHKEGGYQNIEYGDYLAMLSLKSKSNCLGADCTTGVWLMRHMIQANVPGTYVFHAAEEIGGQGSSYIAKECKDRLEGIQFAIAFDRKGTDEIITHQMGERMASNAFAESLAEVLRPLRYRASDGGTFTDTANYSEIIPECCNISVGYNYQHTATEYQNLYHAEVLLDQLIMAQWDRLVCERDPKAWNIDDGWYTDNRGGEYYTRLADYVRSNPQAVADFLEANGFNEMDVESYTFGEETNLNGFWDDNKAKIPY